MSSRARLWRSVKWLAALFAVLVLAVLVWSWWQARQERAALAARPHSFEGIVPNVADVENGARAYHAAKRLFEDSQPVMNMRVDDALSALEAATACTCVPDEDATAPAFDAETRAAIARFMAEAEPAYDALVEGQALPETQFIDYATLSGFPDPGMFHDTLNAVRTPARYAATRARWAMIQGEPEVAVAWVVRTLKAANALDNDVSLLAMMLKCAMGRMGAEVVNDLLCMDGSVELPESLWEELAKLRDRDTLAQFVEGEAVLGMRGMDQMGASQGVLAQVLVFGRSRVPYLEGLDEIAAAIGAEGLEPRREIYQSIYDNAAASANKPQLFVNLSDVTLPAAARGAESAERLIAESILAETALYLERYRQNHGRFPDTLTALIPDYVEQIPEDPFVGGPLRYEATNTGYTLTAAGLAAGGRGPASLQGRNAASARHFGEITWCVTRATVAE